MVCVSVMVKRTMYQCKVNVDMLYAVKSVLPVLSVSPLSELMLEMSANTLFTVLSISISVFVCLFVCLFVCKCLPSAVTVLSSIPCGTSSSFLHRCW